MTLQEACDAKMVLYLPGTTGEPPPTDQFVGIEIVCAPMFTNSGKCPWKNRPPDWLSSWVANEQVIAPRRRWSLVGFSRGAAWALILAAEERLFFDRVLVVAPYKIPSFTDPEQEKIIAAVGGRRPGTLCVAFGSNDYWGIDPMMKKIKEILEAHLWRTLEGKGHETSLAPAMSSLWPGVIWTPLLELPVAPPLL